MPSFSINSSAQLGNVSGQQQTTITDNLMSNIIESIPAAQPGSLTTRTNNTAGTLTMTNANHGITTGQRLDLYWTGGQAYGAVAGTVSGTSVPIASVAGGSALPAANTAINVGLCQQVLVACTGNNLSAKLEALPTGSNGYYVFDSSAPADLLADYVVGGIMSSWFTGNGVTNPLAAVTVASVWMSHNNTAGSQTMQCALLSH